MLLSSSCRGRVEGRPDAVENILLHSKSPRETVRFGKKLGSLLRPGDVVALTGELGTGKTQLIKGLAAGIGIGNPAYVSSPSFTLIHEYQGKIPLYHIDLFRLKDEGEAEGLGLEEYLRGGGVTAIEWADRIPSTLPEEILLIHIRYTGKNTRSLEITGRGNRYKEIVSQLGNSDSN